MIRRILKETHLHRSQTPSPSVPSPLPSSPVASFTRKTPYPYIRVSELSKKYGKYSKYFQPVEDPLEKFNDQWDKHQTLVNFTFGQLDEGQPRLYFDNWVAPCATLSGKVELWTHSSIWYGCVIRADHIFIRIGSKSCILDGTVITDLPYPLGPDHDGSTIVGHDVTVESGCILRGCTVENRCVVGARSTLLEGSYMEQESKLGAGSLLLPNQRVPSGQLWEGNPAKFVRELTPEEIIDLGSNSTRYYNYARVHKDQFEDPSTLYSQAEKQPWIHLFSIPNPDDWTNGEQNL